MPSLTPRFRAVVSSDWSECLSPTGPFDFIAFHFPELLPRCEEIFRSYTGNRITLGEACDRLRVLLPGPVEAEAMDAYLERGFAVYRGVPELMAWCRERDILFLINTTAMIGYFQRVLASRRLPPLPALSANAFLRYPPSPTDPAILFELRETADKAVHTEQTARRFGIPPARVVVIGDSGGDGPHFEWAHRAGAFTIGSMTKESLSRYCAERSIPIGYRFGVSYAAGEARDPEREERFDFMDLAPLLSEVLAL